VLWYATGVLMKTLFVVLVVSVVALLIAALAMWWRLRRHLWKSDKALAKALREIETEHESVEKLN